MIGKLEPVKLREIWAHEALDFTTWLFDNLDILNEQIGLSLTPIEREKRVGTFNVDILAEDASGRPVIIENQLGKTDHDHLGKLLTYFSNLNAKIGIWVATDTRPEHVTVINYLNEMVPTDTHFYLINLQAYKIGDSAPAPLFTVEAGPTEERSAGGQVKKEFAERNKKLYDFFEQLLAQCNEKTKLFSNISPQGSSSWLTATAGKGGVAWQIMVRNDFCKVELLLYSSDADVNHKRYDFLIGHKAEIENKFGEPLFWDYKVERKQHYIRSVSELGGLKDEDKWEKIHTDIIERLIRLNQAMKPFIKKIT